MPSPHNREARLIVQPCQLARRILDQGGVLLSQFEPGTRPYPANFLNRNRVIAGLARGVLVVQASKRSGSLVTARYALEAGREVLALPGSVHNRRHEGTHMLIQQGALLVTCPEDILEHLPQLKQASPAGAQQEAAANLQLSAAQQRIYQTVSEHGPIAAGELQQQLSGMQGFMEELLELELQGLVRRLPGNFLACEGLPG